MSNTDQLILLVAESAADSILRRGLIIGYKNPEWQSRTAQISLEEVIFKWIRKNCTLSENIRESKKNEGKLP